VGKAVLLGLSNLPQVFDVSTPTIKKWRSRTENLLDHDLEVSGTPVWKASSLRRWLPQENGRRRADYPLTFNEDVVAALADTQTVTTPIVLVGWKELAKVFGVTESTAYKWKENAPAAPSLEAFPAPALVLSSRFSMWDLDAMLKWAKLVSPGRRDKITPVSAALDLVRAANAVTSS